MIVKPRPLLCELHAHTTWSDGTFALCDLVDLYGSHGFDVLVVTDHVLRSDDPWPSQNPDGSHVHALNYGAYLDALQSEATRARKQYDLLVVPGLELTYNDPEPDLAAHPHAADAEVRADRATRRFWHEWRLLGGLIDRFELFNQREVFNWVANLGLPAVAAGDFHRLEHFATWKTLLPCDKTEAGVVSYLRSSRPAYITRLERSPRLAA